MIAFFFLFCLSSPLVVSCLLLVCLQGFGEPGVGCQVSYLGTVGNVPQGLLVYLLF